MTENAAVEWLTVPDLVEILDLSPSRVRRLIDDHQLLAGRIDGVLKVPAIFLRDGEPLSELQGTVTVLSDAGFSDEETEQISSIISRITENVKETL